MGECCGEWRRGVRFGAHLAGSEKREAESAPASPSHQAKATSFAPLARSFPSRSPSHSASLTTDAAC